MVYATIRDSVCHHDYTVLAGDLNRYGIMHGGRLLTLCDEVGYLSARQHANGSCLTKAIHQVRFHHPVQSGEMITLQAMVGLTGHSSLWVAVEVCKTKSRACMMDGVFVYAAIDAHGSIRQVSEIRADTEADRQLQEHLQGMRKQLLPSILK